MINIHFVYLKVKNFQEQLIIIVNINVAFGVKIICKK